MAAGKKFLAAKEQVEQRPYTVPDAMGLLKKIHLWLGPLNTWRLGADPKHADQMVQGGLPLDWDIKRFIIAQEKLRRLVWWADIVAATSGRENQWRLDGLMPVSPH
jgi:hypothetical protein